MPDGRVGRFEVPEGTTPEQAQSLISQELQASSSVPARDYTVGEAASKALTRGAKQIGSAFGDVIPAMIGKSLGFDEYAKDQMAEAQATQQEIAEKYAPEVASYKDVKGLGSAATYGLETVLEQVPNLATSIIPGGIGAQVGRRAAIAAGEKALAGEAAGALGQGLTREEALRAAQRLYGQEAAQGAINAGVASGVNQGAAAGLYLGSYAQNAPEIFQNIYESTGKMEPGAAAIAGTAAAALDTALPAYILNKFAGPARAILTERVLLKSGMEPSLARAAIATLPEAAGLEGLTEAAQEAISIQAENYIAGNIDKFTSEQWDRVMESGIKGAVAGLGFGAPTTVANYARQRMDASQQQLQDQQALEAENQAALEGSDVVGLRGAADETVDREGLGADISVPEQPVQQKVSRKSKRAVEPGVIEPTEDIGGPTVGEAAEPSTLEETVEPIVEQEAPVTPTPIKSNLTDEAEELLASVAAGGTPGFMTSNLRRISEENGIPVSKSSTPNIVIQALQDKRDAYMAAQEQQQAEQTTEQTTEQANEDPFSKVDEIVDTGETADTIGQTLKDEFGSNVDLARKRGLLNIVNSAEELPAEARDKLPPNAVGIFHKGVSHIIANRIDKPGARKALLHELGEHYGLEGMVGKDIYKQVLRQVKNLSLTDPTVKAAQEEIIRLYPELQNGSEAQVREVLARVGESAPNNSLWRKIVGAVKNFLTKMGLYNPNKMSTADIQDLILHSLRTSLKKGEVKAPAAEGTPQFSKVSTASADPKMAAAMLQSVGDTVKNLPALSGELGQGITDALSRSGPMLRKIALSFMSLPNKVDLYGYRLPQLAELQTYLEQRASRSDQLRSEVDKATFEYMRVLNRHPSHIVRKFNKITTQLSAANIDPRDTQNENEPLVQAYKNLPKELQKLGTDISDKYAEYSNQMLDIIEGILSIKPGTKESLALRERFEKRRLSFYQPLRRKGGYWMSYLDKDGEMQIIARESPAERARAKKEAQSSGGSEFVEFTRLENADYKAAPPVGFIKDVINILDKQLADVQMSDADKDGIKNQVYQTYLDLLPAEALRQQFREREGIPGYIEDIVGGFADTGAKLASQLANLEYRIKIDGAVSDLQAELGVKRGEQATDLEELTAVVQDVVDQKSFLNNPVADTISSRMGWVSYMWNIAGNISSAVVNMTQLLMVVYPMLAGRYGLGKATSMMIDAAGRYFKGGLDNNREFLPDWTFGASLKEGDKYYDLYQAAIRQSAIRRGVGYELTELRRRTAEDFTGTKAKIETALGWVFQNTERMNREITIMAAYDLALQSGKTKNQAIEEALDLSNRVHSHALSEAGPKMFQTGFGKVAFTFKRFAQQQIYNVARLGYLAFKDLDPKERKIARAQLLGIMGATYTFSGVQGLPLYGAANMLASAMAGLFGDEDEPYDFDEEVRRSIGMLGYKGPLNLITNIDIASRTGFNGMVWRDDPRRLAEVGFGAYFAEHFFGPAYQALLINPQRAEELWTQGQTSKAIETVLPAFAKNPIKAMRFATEGALTSNGAPIVDDISAYSSFMQIFGFSNAELSEAYARAGSMKTAEKAIQARRTSLLDLHFLAKNAGDTDMLAVIDDKIQGYNESYPQNKISRDTLNRSYRGHMQRIEDSVNGVYLNKKLKAQLMEAEYGDELPD